MGNFRVSEGGWGWVGNYDPLIDGLKLLEYYLKYTIRDRKSWDILTKMVKEEDEANKVENHCSLSLGSFVYLVGPEQTQSRAT